MQGETIQASAPVATEFPPLTQAAVMELLDRLALHSEAQQEKFKELLEQVRAYHTDSRGRDVQALNGRIMVQLVTPARAGICRLDGLDKFPALWAAHLLQNLAQPLHQLKVAEISRISSQLLEKPINDELSWVG